MLYKNRIERYWQELWNKAILRPNRVALTEYTSLDASTTHLSNKNKLRSKIPIGIITGNSLYELKQYLYTQIF